MTLSPKLAASKTTDYHKILDMLIVEDLSMDSFATILNSISKNDELQANTEEFIQILLSAGANIAINDDKITLSTRNINIQDTEFCFVDIETNGSKPDNSSIIEIGAIKYKNGKILGKFESFIYAPKVPGNITYLTGIKTSHIRNAPKIKEVLEKFRVFIGNSVFVAHNVGFDYGFIDFHMYKNGLFGLYNPKLCTIDLAKKTILSPRYALSFLNEFLGINTSVSHRAYADALSAMRVFEISCMCLPDSVGSAYDLLRFSKLGRAKYK